MEAVAGGKIDDYLRTYQELAGGQQQGVPAVPQPQDDQALSQHLEAYQSALAPGGVTSAFMRGINRMQQDWETAKYEAGISTPQEFARGLAEQERDLNAWRPSLEEAEKLREFAKIKGAGATAVWLLKNPGIAANLMAESLGQTLLPGVAGVLGGSAAGSAAGGPVGTVAGGVAGAAVAGGLQEYLATIRDKLQERGVRLDDEKNVARLLQDENFMSEVREFAIRRGVPVGAFEGLATLLGMKGAGRVLSKPVEGLIAKTGRSVGPRASIGLEVAGQTAIEAASGSAGEAAAQVASGQPLSGKEIVLEGLLELGPGAAEGVSAIYAGRGERPVVRNDDAVSEPGPQHAQEDAQPQQAPQAVPEEIGQEQHVPEYASPDIIGEPFGTYGEEILRARPLSEEEAMAAADELEPTHRVRNGRETALAVVHRNPDGSWRVVAGDSDPGELYGIMRGLQDRGETADIITLPQKEAKRGRVLTDVDVSSAPRPSVSIPSYLASRMKPVDVAMFQDRSKPVIRKIGSMSRILPTGTFGNMRNAIVDMKKTAARLPEGTAVIPDIVNYVGVRKVSGQQAATAAGNLKAGLVAKNGNGRAVIEKVAKAVRNGLGAAGMQKHQNALTEAIRNGDVEVADIDRIARHFGFLVDADPETVSAAAVIRNLSLDPGEDIASKKGMHPRAENMLLGETYVSSGFEEDERAIIDEAVKIFRRFDKKTKLVIEADRSLAGSGSVTMMDAGKVAVIKIKPVRLREDLSNSLGADADTMRLVQHVETIFHELGHVIAATSFARAPKVIQSKVWGSYLEWRGRVAAAREAGLQEPHISPRDGRFQGETYFLTFAEWFAREVSYWATADKVPVTSLQKFVRSIAQKVKRFYEAVAGRKEKLRVSEPLAAWLDAVVNGEITLAWDGPWRMEFDVETTIANSKATHGTFEDTQQTAVSAPVREVMRRFINDKEASKWGAIVDGFGKFHQWALHIKQVATLYPQIAPLQEYVGIIDDMQTTQNGIMVQADIIRKQWMRLPKDEREALGKLLYDLSEEYNQIAPEVEEGIVNERLRSEDARAVYWSVRKEMKTVIERYYDIMLREANQISNDEDRAKAIAEAEEWRARYINTAYFPFMRFGKYALNVRLVNRSADGEVKMRTEHFELFETRREANAALAEAKRRWPEGQYEVNVFELPDEVANFAGLPPWMMKKMLSMPGLTETQREWLERMAVEVSPGTQFRKAHFLRRRKTKGWSKDAMRTFAAYMFQHAKSYARDRYAGEARDQVSMLREAARKAPGNNIGLSKLAAYLADHLDNVVLNPANDWAQLRSVVAVWYLGGSVKSAVLNMTQLLVGTFPFLSQHFGTLQTMNAMRSAASRLQSYYTTERLVNEAESSDEIAALAQAVKDNVITESLAVELAAASAMDSEKYARAKGSRGWIWFSGKTMWLFQLTEQFNRRVTFIATRALALQALRRKKPPAWIIDVQRKHDRLIDGLINERGWTPTNAIAYAAAKDAVEQTQFVYNRLYRPRFMRGKRALLFAFWMFIQNTMFMVGNRQNRGMLPHYIGMMLLLAGPMGLVPDEIEDIIDYIINKIWGPKALDVEVRKIVKELFGDDVPADLLLHGISRYSFGLPWLMESIGINFMPQVDMSGSIGWGRMLPIVPTGMLKPGTDYEKAFTEVGESLGGAAVSIGANLMKALMDNSLEWDDPKRWERTLPIGVKNIVRSWRWATEGVERSRNYTEIAQFDMSDSRQLAEVIANALGFQPTRMKQIWERNAMAWELQTRWRIERGIIYERALRAFVLEKDQEQQQIVREAIRDYNRRVPYKKLRITGKSLKASLRGRNRRRQGEWGIAPGILLEMNELYPEADKTGPWKRIRKPVSAGHITGG